MLLIFFFGPTISRLEEKKKKDTVLFNNTIGYNIRYGRPDATDEDVVQAAKQANIHEMIEALPDKYNTKVGERGLMLSGNLWVQISLLGFDSPLE